MMLGRGKDVEASVIGEHGELAQLVEHLLITIAVTANRSKLTTFFEGGGNGW